MLDDAAPTVSPRSTPTAPMSGMINNMPTPVNRLVRIIRTSARETPAGAKRHTSRNNGLKGSRSFRNMWPPLVSKEISRFFGVSGVLPAAGARLRQDADPNTKAAFRDTGKVAASANPPGPPGE